MSLIYDSVCLDHRHLLRSMAGTEEVLEKTGPLCVEQLRFTPVEELLSNPEMLALIIEQADDEIVFPPERQSTIFRSNAPLTNHEL